MRWPASVSGAPSGGDTRIGDRVEDGLDLLAEVLVGGRQGQLLAERLERLVDVEARAQGRDLEEDAARLPEVDRAEVEAIDHRCGPSPLGNHPVTPGLVLVDLRGPGDVVDAPRALKAALGRRGIEPVEPAAALAPGLPVVLASLEPESLLEERPARVGVARVGAGAV